MGGGHLSAFMKSYFSPDGGSYSIRQRNSREFSLLGNGQFLQLHHQAEWSILIGPDYRDTVLSLEHTTTYDKWLQ